jgi:hypothetical protein
LLLVLGLAITGCERGSTGEERTPGRPPVEADGSVEPDWSLGAPDGGEPADAGTAPAAHAGITYSPDAKFATYDELRQDLTAAKHPADGGGRAWLTAPTARDGGRPRVVAGGRERFAVVYEAGPEGVAEGGVVFLQPSPFWGWDTPQTTSPHGSGFTEVKTEADGVRLRAETVAPLLLAIHVEGRALKSGERIEMVFGAGPAKARVDTYAESESRLWLAVDGDGDGVRAVLVDSPAIDIMAGPPAHLALYLPTTAKPGEDVRVHLSVLDALGNAGAPFEGEIELAVPPGLSLPAIVTFTAANQGTQVLEGSATTPGIYRVIAHGPGELLAESNPLVVDERAAPILWADLHGHSNLSDGTGTPDDYFAYARDVAGLDVVALTDHDHWGMLFLDGHPEMWRRIEEATQRFNEPGRFVAVLGYEWTSWLQGHRHVLYFTDRGRVLSSMDTAYDTPSRLWDALRGQPALTFAHHSAGGPVATNWDFPPDPELEPLTEITSVHGSSEAWDTPRRIYHPVRGNFVRDVLGRGYHLGFIGSGDSHDGHPGLPQIASPARSGGLAAILGAERTRESVLEALRARRVYATNGPRILLRMLLDGSEMGSILEAAAIRAENQQLEVRVASPLPLARVDLVRGRAGGEPTVDSVQITGEREWSVRKEIPRLAAGEYVYLRAIQADEGAGWSSPIYAR